MNRPSLALLLLPVLAVVMLLGCGGESDEEDLGVCGAADQAGCEDSDSDNGYGKCVWADGACSAPTVASSCATYPDQASCEAPCTWEADACTGDNAGPGLPCSNYTTKVACEIPCGWDGAACVPAP
jgi:hypothetical protein